MLHRIAASILCVLALCSVVSADDFANPPESARPWVYWFWINGNITAEGITADLEAMKHVGIGGVLIMEVDQGVPVGPMDFMGAKWRELFLHAVKEADRLGLEINMNNDAGWNGSGGPWIKPEQSMQKVVWTEKDVKGPLKLAETLVQPETKANYYEDIAVLAFPTPGDYRIENIAGKSSLVTGFTMPGLIGEIAPEMCIARDRVLDISGAMKPDGRLEWDAPEGNWTIVRFGHTTTGVENAPSPATGRGLECDKLSKEGIEAQFNGMMAKIIEDAGPLAGKSLTATHIDSWENGAQNWTAKMREEFRTRRGYEMLPFLPVMTGRVVGTLEQSERFLWDLRQTVSDLLVENYAGHLGTLAKQHGMRLSIEAYGGPCDNMPYAGRADEPMGEYWVGGNALQVCKEMASAAHAYGKPILGAEACTADNSERWQEHPATLKQLCDRAFCTGINRLVFHRYAMQPWLDKAPGMTMGPWGVHYERTQTWWDMSTGWHAYLARCQNMLRRGLYVADICYLQAETAPQGGAEHPRNGHDYDMCGAEVVMTRMSVRDGRIVLPDGMSYRLLVLPEVQTMTPGLLRKIKELVESGATVLGNRPQKSPSLSGYPACDDEVKQLGEVLWGDGSVKDRAVGKGRILSGMSFEDALKACEIKPDFQNWDRLDYIHRVDGDTDIYFVTNPRSAPITATCAFRVSGKRPEFWWPDSGKTEYPSVFSTDNAVTTVVIPFDPSGSVFVVFRPDTRKTDSVVAASHNGLPIFSAQRIAPQIKVTRARYGVLDDPARTRDVKETVQALVDAGEYHFRVARMAQDGDPAFLKLKQLSVEYAVGDESFEVTGNDNDTVHLTGDSTRIVIEKATYGVLTDPARTRDVKAKLQHLVDTGVPSFQVTYCASGDDPAVGVVKTLILEYTVGGKQFSTTATDASSVTLYEPPARKRFARPAANAEKEICVEVLENGDYDFTTASGVHKLVSVNDLPAPFAISGPWSVAFPDAIGNVDFPELVSLSEHSNPDVKHFSGTAIYTKAFDAPAKSFDRLYLDLGNVQVMARVKLNGKDLGILWKPPYRVEVTNMLKPTGNELEIEVVNLWINRLIGDEQLPPDTARNEDGTLKEWPQWLKEGKTSPTGRKTFTTWRLWSGDETLRPSGLIGPVRIESVRMLKFAEK